VASACAGVVLLDVGANGVHITNQSEIYRLQPEARSRINAFYMTSCFVGAAAGSAVAAFVYQRWSWDGVCALGVAIGLLSLALWAFGARGRLVGGCGALKWSGLGERMRADDHPRTDEGETRP
jgi:predicted MFS family arabinose efflux permease